MDDLDFDDFMVHGIDPDEPHVLRHEVFTAGRHEIHLKQMSNGLYRVYLDIEYVESLDTREGALECVRELKEEYA